ncbi:MAG: RIP metalloprotease RseP [Bacteroidales bacterium]|nr:RIP metalloprotease RseP [Bacteroidales bacterium]
MEILIKALQLILSLSILVAFHEAGHFVAARVFKTRVEKFYLFFNPWFSLFKFKYKETEYGLGWLPLGGYVKISGMIDESMDKEQMKKPAEPWEFRAKPAWQRLIIMLGGVSVNLILGFLIYSMVLFTWGEEYIATENLKDGIWVLNPVAEDAGVQTGDKILSIGGEKINRVSDITGKLIYGGNVQVERNGERVSFEIPEDFISKLIDADSKLLFWPRIPFTIAAVSDSSVNVNSGLQIKDQIIAVNGNPIKYYDEYIALGRENRNSEITLKVKREDQMIDISVVLDSAGKMGVAPHLYSYADLKRSNVYEFNIHEYTFLEAIPAGWNKAMNKLNAYVKQFKLIFNPSTGAYKGLGGFGAIGNLFPPTWEWSAFWEITAFLSLILAFMNVLPIPALDGGHVMFLMYEIVTGREANEKFLEYAQIVGMILLLSLLVLANGNDILRALN